jgi:hypothetical protein
METGEIFAYGEHPEGSITLNELRNGNKLIEVFPYDEFNYEKHVYPANITLCETLFRKIQSHFQRNGYKVSIEAIEHCLTAWSADLKSGYRDEENGYHLFSPCGCNPLSLRLTTLSPLCESWQQTYEC